MEISSSFNAVDSLDHLTEFHLWLSNLLERMWVCVNSNMDFLKIFDRS